MTKRIGLDGIVTIDGTPDLFLNNVESFVDNTRERSHLSAVDAVRNFQFTSGVAGNIVGHGIPGVISTGRGKNFASRTSFRPLYISHDDDANGWEQVARDMRTRGEVQITKLTVCACYAGAETEGALLLHRLANAFGVVAEGPTGYVQCTNFGQAPTLLTGTWQRAEPDADPPTPIPGGSRVRLTFQALGERLITLNIFPRRRRITRVTVELIPGATRLTARSLEFSGAKAAAAGRFLGLDSPLHLRGLCSAITGRVVVEEAESNGHSKIHTFAVHNDELLQDPTNDSRFFNADLAGLLR